MATITFKGLEEYQHQMETLGREYPKAINASIYEGARVLADAVKAEIKGLDIRNVEKQGLLDGLGIAHFWSENGKTMTKIGFDGYNADRTKKWPKGKPNAMIARTVIRGTSWLTPDRFVDRATRKARNDAIAAIRERLDAEIKARTETK